MFTDDELSEMERLADVAGPKGQWIAQGDLVAVRCLPRWGHERSTLSPFVTGQDHDRARHIASSSPDRIKALIAEVRRLRACLAQETASTERATRAYGNCHEQLCREQERAMAAEAEVRQMRPVVEAARLARLALHIDDAERATVLLDHVGSLIDKVGAQ